MKVYTKYPVYVDNKEVSNADFYLNVDANDPAQIKAFQNWLDIKYPTWFNGSKLNKDESKGYGTYNDATKKAYETYGTEFMSAVKQTIQTVTPLVATASQTALGILPKSYKSEEELRKMEEEKKKEERKKKMRTTLLIGGGVLVVVAVVVYMLVKSKPSEK